MLTWLRMLVGDQRRRLAFTVCALTVVAAVVGMHQMSVNHTLVAARPTATDRMAIDGALVSSSTLWWIQAAEAMRAPAEAGQPSTGVVTDRHCDGDCHHPGAMTACMLALTLAVVAWLLRPPLARWLPLQSRLRMLPLAGPPGLRRRPALSLTELSLRRT